MRDVASQRSKRIMRGALAATAVIAAVGLAPSATAAPPTNDPTQNNQQLAAQAAQLGEQINNAQADLNNKNAEAAKATGDVTQAKAAEQVALQAEDKVRGQADQLTSASFEGARMSQQSALLTGTSAKDFLTRAEDLQDLAANNYAVLSKFAVAVNATKAAEARAQHDLQTAQDATAAAESLKAQLNQESTQLQHQAAQLLADKSKFTPQELAQLLSTGVKGVFVAPPGVRGAAMTIALNERGKSYVWAGAGPNVFDCSGLVMWSYAQAGMPGIPHSAAAQQQLGVPVSKADMQPGDLVFFGVPASHVGIYVGNGLMVDAPHTGAVVRVEPLFSDFSNARRLGS
jgi:cell wall-associated NlpC family hydrolase